MNQHGASLAQRAAGYGLRYVAVYGNDVAATAAAMEDVVLAARAGDGPAVVEAATYRWHGHYEGDPQRYREALVAEEWQRIDPIRRFERRGREEGWLDGDASSRLEQEAREAVEEAVAFARASPFPPADLIPDLVYAT